MKLFSRLFIGLISFVFIIHFSAMNLYPGWFKHYGGTNIDSGRSIHQNSNGTYILAGFTYSFSFGGYDFAIYKLNSSGNKIWFKHYGGANDEKAYSIQQTSDGGYIVAGYTESFTYGSGDIAVYKLNSSGNKVWFKHYGGANDERAYSIQQTSDGGYIVAGYTESFTYGSADIAVYKLNSSGNKVWFKHYGGSSGDYGRSIQQTLDGGYIVAGYTYSYTYGMYDIAVYKLNSNGSKQWFKHYGGSLYDNAYSIQQTSDGGYIVAGNTESYTYGNDDFAIYKLNSSGNKIWFKHYGGSSEDVAYSIRQNSDGSYIVAGSTTSYSYGGGCSDFAIYKLNSLGNKAWFRHYGGTSGDSANSTQQISEGGYIVAGDTNSYTYGSSDIGVYKLNSNGNK